MSPSERENVSQAAGVVGFYTFLSRILGLVRDMVLARYFGAGIVTDAFFVAFRIPNLLRRLFAEGSLTVAFIPVFTEYLGQKTEKDAFELARIVLTLLSVVLTLVTILGVLFSPWIVRVQAFGFGGAGLKYDLTVLLTRITFPYILLISIVALFMGILNSLRHFAAPAAAPIFLNVGIILSIVSISPHFSQPIVGVAVGVLIGGILQVGLQIPWALKKGLSLLPLWMPHHPALRRIVLLMVPTVFGSAIYQFNQFVGTLLASFLADGSVSWLYYADRLVQFPLGVFAVAVSTAALPSLSRQAAERELKTFRETLDHAMGLVFYISIPSMTGLIVLGKPMIEVLFQGGAFGPLYTTMTARALLFYSLGLWAFSGIRIMLSAFYALQDTKTPVKIALAAAGANLFFSLALMGPLAHGGLALALSLASVLQFLLLGFFFRRKIDDWDLRPVILSASKCFLAAIVMGLGLYLFHNLWRIPGPEAGVWGQAFHLAGLVLFGALLYFGTTSLLGCRELAAIFDLIRPVTGKIRK